MSVRAPRPARSPSPGAYTGSDNVSDRPSPSPTTRTDGSEAQSAQQISIQQHSLPEHHLQRLDGPVDLNSSFNTLPTVLPKFQQWNSDFIQGWQSTITPDLSLLSHNEEYYLGTIGDAYSQYLHTPYIPNQPLQSLNEEQQIELMSNLEKNSLNGLDPVSHTMPELNLLYNY